MLIPLRRGLFHCLRRGSSYQDPANRRKTANSWIPVAGNAEAGDALPAARGQARALPRTEAVRLRLRQAGKLGGFRDLAGRDHPREYFPRKFGVTPSAPGHAAKLSLSIKEQRV